LTQLTASITPDTNANNPVTFTYGGSQQRVLKQQSDQQKLYLHGANSYPLIELEKTGTATESVTFYIYGPTGLIAFAPGATQGNTNFLYVLKDRQSSTRAVVDGTTQQVIAAYNYLPFGDLMGEVYGSSVIAYLYTGQEYDAETGLYNYRARFYDSSLGRFYGPDPAGQQPSPFAYAGNDPILFSDKTGRVFGIDDLLIGLLVGALIGAAIGAVAGGIGYAVTHTDDFNVGDFFKNIGIGALTGAVAGAVGFGVGSATSSAVTSGLTSLGVSTGQSVVAGVASGIISGASGGAVASVSGQLLNNALSGQPLGAGLGEAALTGAIIGGITGGIGGAFAARAAARSSTAVNSGSSVRGRFTEWLNLFGDQGGQTNYARIPGTRFWPRFNTNVTNNDLPGTWGYLDTAAHEGFHAGIGRYAGIITLAGDARLGPIPIGAPVKYLEEVFAYSIGHGAALRFHGIPLAPIEAYGSLSRSEGLFVFGLKGTIGGGIGLYEGLK
jgi:RHS repeat-associated protein